MQAQSQFITLRDRGESKAVVAPELGAWLLRWLHHLPEFGYVDVLFYDPAVVERYPNQMYAGNPLLFPLVSFNHSEGLEHHYRWQGQLFPMGQHGFARRSPWKVVHLSESTLTMELASSGQTEKHYPFSFRHSVTYELEAGRLHFRQSVENTSRRVMPFSTGIHPYLPAPIIPGGKRDDCWIELPESRQVSNFKNWESWTAEPCPPQRLSLRHDFSGTMFLTDLHRPEVSLVDPAAGLRIRLNFEGAPQHRFLALWSKSADSPFFCIEPWTALPNSFSRTETELVLLDPGQRFEAAMWLALEKAP